MENYYAYLEALKKPFKKIAKLEFLNPDESVAFAISNRSNPAYPSAYDSRAFLQEGNLNVSLNNGARRSASVTIANVDGAFDYAFNKLWFGTKIRLLMGLILPNGTEYYIPQGVFYLRDPKSQIEPSKRQITYSLVDKWAYLDGTLFGTLPQSHVIAASSNVFQSMQGVLQLSRFNMLQVAEDPFDMLDSTPPIFTNYYNNLPPVEYQSGGITQYVSRVDSPYEIIEQVGAKAADLMIELNNMIVGMIGYDPTGALRVEPSQENILDSDKPLLWQFNSKNSVLFSKMENSKNTQVYNDVVVIGEGLKDAEVYGRATNLDPRSDTNVNAIGLKTYQERRADLATSQQCADTAAFLLKKKTILQKSITINCSQMFHLMENRLISVERTDKPGAPVERHLIQSFSIPIGETGQMSINATSVNDIPDLVTAISY